MKPADVPSEKAVNGAAGFPFDFVGGHMPPIHSGEPPLQVDDVHTSSPLGIFPTDCISFKIHEENALWGIEMDLS